MAFLATVVFLYDIVATNDLSNDMQILFAYGSNMVISFLCIPAIPITAARMSAMGSVDDESDEEEEEENHDRFSRSK